MQNLRNKLFEPPSVYETRRLINGPRIDLQLLQNSIDDTQRWTDILLAYFEIEYILDIKTAI